MSGRATARVHEAKVKMLAVNLDNAVGALANAILITSRALAPMSDIEGHAGTLRRSGRVEKLGLSKYQVVYGSGIKDTNGKETGDAPYAAYQERGMWPDGTHVIKNHTTPGTQTHYLLTAGQTEIKQGFRRFL